jgi:ribosome recycling factor
MLGMSDTIQEDDMFVDITRIEIEQELEKVKKNKEVTDDRIKSAEDRMDRFDEVIVKLGKFLERV